MNNAGRLKIAETMSALTVTLPGEQHMIFTLYWGFGLLMAMLMFLTSLGTGFTCLGAMLLSWLPLSWLIRRIQYGQSWASWVLLVVIGLPQLSILFGELHPVGMALLFLFSTWFWFMLVRLLSRPAAELTIDQSTVTVSGVTVPLEELTSLRPPTRWRQARFGETPVRGLCALRASEWAWLEEKLLDGAARRRATLLSEGHDLSSRPATPEALATLIGPP